MKNKALQILSLLTVAIALSAWVGLIISEPDRLDSNLDKPDYEIHLKEGEIIIIDKLGTWTYLDSLSDIEEYIIDNL